MCRALLYLGRPVLLDTLLFQLLRQAGERANQAKAGVWDERALAALKEVCGYPTFQAGQLEIIRAVMAGRDCLGVIPAGAGKSVTYQIPAHLERIEERHAQPREVRGIARDQSEPMGQSGRSNLFVDRVFRMRNAQATHTCASLCEKSRRFIGQEDPNAAEALR